MSLLSPSQPRVNAAAPFHSDGDVCSSRARFREAVSALTVVSERSNHIFSSPLGPGYRDGRHFTLPRFVYFGPHTHEESLRLAFYAGADSHDLRTSFALLHLVERLSLEPDLGQGLNLSFFPLLDATDHKSVDLPGRLVTAENWATAERAEVDLLRRDVRVRAYHGFVRLEPADVDVITVRLSGRSSSGIEPTGVELVSSDDFVPLDVQWEAASELASATGPLSLSDDLPFHAFELVLQFPRHWTAELYQEAIGLVLRRFVRRYRAVQAYGQHL